jgi:hypothetical protein
MAGTSPAMTMWMEHGQGLVMPALVAGIHVFESRHVKGVDGRDEPGHDDGDRRVLDPPLCAGMTVRAWMRRQQEFVPPNAPRQRLVKVNER